MHTLMTQVLLLLMHDSRPLPHQLRVRSRIIYSLMLIRPAAIKKILDAIKVKSGAELSQCLVLVLMIY